MDEMKTWLYNNLFPLLTLILSPFISFWVTKKKFNAEAKKLESESTLTNAEAEKTQAEADKTRAETKTETEKMSVQIDAMRIENYRKIIDDLSKYNVSLISRNDDLFLINQKLISKIETLEDRIDKLEHCQVEKDELLDKIAKYERFFKAQIKAFDYLAGVFSEQFPAEIENAKTMIAEYEKELK